MKFLRVLSLFLMVYWLSGPVALITAAIVIIVLLKKNKEYKNSAYYQVTKYPYLSVRYNTGRYGEYLTYKYLKHMEEHGARFLFNVYVPKANGETAEIDVLMISPKGIFVFESKNYSGWIFGSENQKNWYQTLPAGRGRSHKEHFYNPVMQNRSHIKHLRTFLGNHVPVHSIIVFSDRCTLKSVQIQSKDISVINRYDVESVVSEICDQISTDLLSESEIADIHKKLYPLTQVDEASKMQHIANIHNNLNDRPAQQVPDVQPASDVQEKETEAPITFTEAATVSVDSVAADSAESSVETVEPKTVEIPQQFKCPWCNSRMVLRTAKRGVYAGNQFYGCSNYPKCRYIQNISNEKTV